MSVEITGAAGYEYQDLICLYLSVLLSELEGVECKIENANGEDCELKYIFNNQEYIIDVQVKSRADFIEIDEFSKWISHFEKHNWDKHLLNKLKENQSRFLLFITNNRVENDLTNFVVSESNLIHLNIEKSFNSEIINKLKGSINNAFDDSTNLSAKRKETLHNFNTENNDNIFRSIFRKINIWEMKDESSVKSQLEVILNKKYLVSKSKLPLIMPLLLQIIKNNKNTNKSVIEEINLIIDNYSEATVFSKETLFIENNEFANLKANLRDKHTLLLSGVSLCGKSFCAKKIASEYQNKGYFCLITSEVDEALNFITKKDNEDKIVILEDPFGAIVAERGSSEVSRKLNIMCSSSSINRKIIITSRKDILLRVNNQSVLSACTVVGQTWFDLTNDNEEFLEEYWKTKIQNEEYHELFKRINIYLRTHSSDNYLQIGELTHLLNTNSVDTLVDTETTILVDRARVNSHDLANLIINDLSPIHKKVFMALAISCNTTKPLKPRHLHYILSNSTDYYSIKDERHCLGISLIGIDDDEKNKEIMWDYNGAYDNLSNRDFREAIVYFNQCGYININDQGIIFNHPIYQQAGTIIFLKELQIEFYVDESIYEMLQRGISTTSKYVCNSAVRVLEYLYVNLQRNKVLDLLKMAQNSIFPSVIDRSITFMLSRFSYFDEENKKNIINTLMSNKDNNETIVWNDDEPYILKNELSMRKFIENLIESRSDHFDLLNKENLSSKEIWECLKLEYNEDIKMPYLEFLKKFIYVDEVFIKEKIYYKLFNLFVHEELDLISLLDYNEHPSIIYKSYLGAFNSWDKYSDESKAILITKLRDYLKDAPISIRFLRFLENFQDEYETDGLPWSDLSESVKTDLWEVWYELFSRIFEYFPFEFREMHEAHLVLAADNSLKYIKNPNLIVSFATHWHNWLNSLSSKSYPDDYGMSVARYLMKGTETNSEVRKEIFETLLKDNETSLITSHLSHILKYWNDLNMEEKNQILNLLDNSRKDIKWIKSILLTGDQIPKEIAIKILGKDVQDKDAQEIVKMLNEANLLEPCLNIYTGFPQPLWWNGYHHKNNEFWSNIIRAVLEGEELNQPFKLALKEYIDKLYNYSTRYDIDMELYDRLINSEIKAKIVFEELVLVSATQNQANKKIWDMFLEKSSFYEDPFYINLILENIEALQYQQSKDKDLMEYFDIKFIFGYIIPKFQRDEKLLKLLHLLENGHKTVIKNDGEEIDISKYLEIALQYIPPKLSLVNKIIKITLDQLNLINEKLSDIFEVNRKNYIEIGIAGTKVFKEHYDLDDWID